MDGWMWFVLGLAVVAAAAVVLLRASARAAEVRRLDREHEQRLAQMEQAMWFVSAYTPPTPLLQSRGKPIPDLLGRSRVGKRVEVIGEMVEGELDVTPDDTEQRIDDLETLMSGGREQVAEGAERVRRGRSTEARS